MESYDNSIFDVFHMIDPRISKIINGLYLGDKEAIKDLKLLEELKIKRIIRVGSERAINFHDIFLYINIDIVDGDEENIDVYFKKPFKFIDDGLKRNQNLFIHCRFGISRSVTIIYSYQMQKNKSNFKEIE